MCISEHNDQQDFTLWQASLGTVVHTFSIVGLHSSFTTTCTKTQWDWSTKTHFDERGQSHFKVYPPLILSLCVTLQEPENLERDQRGRLHPEDLTIFIGRRYKWSLTHPICKRGGVGNDSSRDQVLMSVIHFVERKQVGGMTLLWQGVVGCFDLSFLKIKILVNLKGCQVMRGPGKENQIQSWFEYDTTTNIPILDLWASEAFQYSCDFPPELPSFAWPVSITIYSYYEV